MAYDVIVIGAGSSAAYYLGTLRDYDLSKTSQTVSILVIGKADPWGGARGYQQGTYAQNINQSQQMAAHRDGSTAPMSQDARDRMQWAEKNRQIIRAVTGKDPVDEEVVKITKDVEPLSKDSSPHLNRPMVFRVQTRGNVYFGRKVVIATGAGIEDDKHEYHMTPPEATAFLSQNSGNKACMNLDTFMRMPRDPANQNKKIIIVGPAAGTDAVMQAGTVGFRSENVYWFMSKVDASGLINVMPAPNRFTREEAEKRIVAVDRSRTISLTKDGKLSVAFTRTGGLSVSSPLEVDYYVYAVGQVQQSALTGKQSDDEAAKSFLDPALLKQLRPLYDVNQQLAEFGKSSAAYQHITGLELEGSTREDGLTVIGAAAYQIAVREKIDHSYLQYEFTTIRSDLTKFSSSFVETANKYYPELIKSPDSLSELRKVKHLRPRLACQERDFLLAFERELKGSLLGDRPASSESRTKAVTLAHDKLREAKDLCYYYRLRVDAAEYLYELDKDKVKLKDKMDVAEMQTSGHKRMLPNTVGGTGGGAAPLLGAVERNVSGMNATVPQHVINPSDVTQGVNFLESPTVIRIFIALHYPNIPEPQAQSFISDVLRQRKTKDNGFSGPEITKFQEQLKHLDRTEELRVRLVMNTRVTPAPFRGNG